MTANQYHILSFIPAIEAWEMPVALEHMAKQLVASGRLRINADTERNFVRHGTADTDETFSRRELTDPKLMPATLQRLKRHVAPAAGPDGVQQLLALMQGELKKTQSVSLEKELRVARALVQSAHPSVIQLLLAARTEIFVSYSHNLGDLMPVHRWQGDALNSGLQATSDTGTAVYVSCGGDPFFEGEHKTYTTDGFPALARMVIIAGQELGHFSDLLRQQGRIVGRYSTDNHHTQLRANPSVANARIQDMQRVQQLKQLYREAGLTKLLAAEKSAAFYSKRWKFSPPWMWHQLRRRLTLMMFRMRCQRTPSLRGGLQADVAIQKKEIPAAKTRRAGLLRFARNDGVRIALHTHPRHMPGQALAMFLEDMAFNLAPEADVYRRSDPLEEEAIACIEALARVPQQVYKWGYAPVAHAWPRLYEIYYGTVIPGCIAATGTAPPINKLPALAQLRIYLRRLIRKRPSYYPE